jgi:membrane protein DedA with SNARE-associated domain
MEDQMNMLMVFCAAVAALALGVMLGYLCCKTLFDVLRFHARMSATESAKAKTQVAQV